ncbi:MAG TPA: heavy metal translocating P-type ATPase [Gemmatimonadaceae bacterium]|nr:heavy metal translocating P-type ATPase [Gemmatimonadaceae bacterium]
MSSPPRTLSIRRDLVIPVASILFIAAGLALRFTAGLSELAAPVMRAGLALTAAPVLWRTVRGVVRGRFAADLVATLAIVTAFILDQPLVGLVVVLMQTGGEAIETYAEGRASDALRELQAMAPKTAHRLVAGRIEDIHADEIVVGDELLVRPGELVPCDGEVIDGHSHVDASRLTGEPIPVSATGGTRLMSGSVNGDGALTMRATARAIESQYARIVALVRSAQASKAPLQRVADRYAVWFTPATLAVCAGAWLVSRDAERVLAVLAIATPCPLILATPIALLGGINRAARRNVIVRHGTALERIGDTTVAVFDKTGTITVGMPSVASVVTAPGWSEPELLSLAGAVERGSSHLLARTLVSAAEERGVTLADVKRVVEARGRGVSGCADGRQVVVGSRSLVLEKDASLGPAFDALEAACPPASRLRALVSVDGAPAGVVVYADALRPGAHEVIDELRRLGVKRTILLSGDRAANASMVADAVGIDEVKGDLLPEDKVDAVHTLVARGENVLMVGDGTNDAPALSAATVGVALAAHGGGVTAEAADIIILADDLGRLVETMQISRRTMHIARQCIRVGVGLSIAGMLGAALGYITPILGAGIQEAIDLAVIINALRASRAG